jgi:hypothetical protein
MTGKDASYIENIQNELDVRPSFDMSDFLPADDFYEYAPPAPTPSNPPGNGGGCVATVSYNSTAVQLVGCDLGTGDGEGDSGDDPEDPGVPEIPGFPAGFTL